MQLVHSGIAFSRSSRPPATAGSGTVEERSAPPFAAPMVAARAQGSPAIASGVRGAWSVVSQATDAAVLADAAWDCPGELRAAIAWQSYSRSHAVIREEVVCGLWTC